MYPLSSGNKKWKQARAFVKDNIILSDLHG